jgi:hypothetical protein
MNGFLSHGSSKSVKELQTIRSKFQLQLNNVASKIDQNKLKFKRIFSV